MYKRQLSTFHPPKPYTTAMKKSGDLAFSLLAYCLFFLSPVIFNSFHTCSQACETFYHFNCPNSDFTIFHSFSCVLCTGFHNTTFCSFLFSLFISLSLHGLRLLYENRNTRGNHKDIIRIWSCRFTSTRSPREVVKNSFPPGHILQP